MLVFRDKTTVLKIDSQVNMCLSLEDIIYTEYFYALVDKMYRRFVDVENVELRYAKSKTGEKYTAWVVLTLVPVTFATGVLSDDFIRRIEGWRLVYVR